ncbi:MAG: ParM/StbA family protein [Sideroxydans sp.]|nr:ParM/StbA family protein [Sideroxydans sp.]MDD5056687.1 ParM/StbA family protein [Sideroxydans sp.]
MNKSFHDAIGFDVGHSTTKISCLVDGVKHDIIFPSVATPAFTISDENEQRRAAEETVDVDGKPYFFGKTALIQGGMSGSTGLSENWTDTPEYEALMRGGFAKVRALGIDPDNCVIVMGLPTNLHSRQKAVLKSVAAKCTKGRVLVVPQSLSPYHGMMLDESGNPSMQNSMETESWAVVELGYWSTDIMLMQAGGIWVEKAAGSSRGVALAADALMRALGEKNVTVGLNEAEQALQTKTIKNFGKNLDVSKEAEIAIGTIVADVLDMSTKLIEPHVRKLDGVIIAGGGAPLVFEAIKAKWPHAILAENHRFAVAEGMRRYALVTLRLDAMSSFSR